ncbi:MAG: DUF1320 domain-containing protein [Chitinophagales bacterium]|nr:DUF1320 domain-containing protein [Chitinophagales bacterium]
MKYLSKDDLITDSFERFIDESSKDFSETIDNNEARSIALVKSYLADRYAVDIIFGENTPPTPPLRNELLVDIISKITLYKIFRRNAARKLPNDIKEDYEWAIQQLTRINSGRVLLDLPPALDDEGRPMSETIWGDLTNPDFYI